MNTIRLNDFEKTFYLLEEIETQLRITEDENLLDQVYRCHEFALEQMMWLLSKLQHKEDWAAYQNVLKKQGVVESLLRDKGIQLH